MILQKGGKGMILLQRIHHHKHIMMHITLQL